MGRGPTPSINMRDIVLSVRETIPSASGGSSQSPARRRRGVRYLFLLLFLASYAGCSPEPENTLSFYLRIENGRRSLWLKNGNKPICLSDAAHVRGEPSIFGNRIAWIEEFDQTSAIRIWSGTESYTIKEAPRGTIQDVALGGYGIAWSEFLHGDWDIMAKPATGLRIFGDKGYDDIKPVVGRTGVAWIRSWGVDVTVQSTLGGRNDPVRLPGDFVEELTVKGDSLYWTDRQEENVIAWTDDGSGPREIPQGRSAIAPLFNPKVPTDPPFSPISIQDWPVEWRQLDPTPVPWPRTTHAMTQIDKGRVFIFGGEIIHPSSRLPVSFGNDTWILDASKTCWTEVNTFVRPPPRCHIPVAFDPKRNIVLLWGGAIMDANGDVHTLGDTWQFNTNTMNWTEIEAKNSPDPKKFANDTGLVWDAVGDRFLMYFRGEIWSYTVEDQQWEPVTANPGPSPRSAVSMIHDPEGNQLLIYGGSLHPEYMNDTWLLDLNTGQWREIVEGSHPPARVRPAFAFDSRHRRAVLYGGVRGPASNRFDDLWVFDFNKDLWICLQKANPASMGSRGGFMGMAYDPAADLFTLFAGRSALKGFHSDTWVFKLGQ